MNLTDFLQDIRLEIRGCPEVVMLHHLRQAIRRFCNEASGVWAEYLEPIAPQAGVTEQKIWVPKDAEAILLLSATHQDEPVNIYTPEQLDALVSDWKSELGAEVKAIIPLQKAVVETIRIYPLPTQTLSQVEIRAALQPTRDATTCPNDFSTWMEPISAGAIASLKKLPNKPWTDRESVAHYEGVFLSGASQAAARAVTGPIRRPLRTTKVGKV